MEQLVWVPGAATWVSDNKDAWIPAKIKSVDKSHVHCVQVKRGADDSETEEQKDDGCETSFHTTYSILLENTAANEGGLPENRHEASNEKGPSTRYMLPRDGNCSVVDNMDNLLHLHEAAVLDNLRRRFEDDNIYTSTGPILVALNPFKDVDLFSQEHMALYQMMQGGDVQTLPGTEYQPHCYKVAQQALDHMRRTKRDQTLITSGESGAGKTVTTKKMLRYLTRSGSTESGSESDHTQGKGVHRIESRIMESNPITEAFGNG
jgi:myosin heavy subunit